VIVAGESLVVLEVPDELPQSRALSPRVLQRLAPAMGGRNESWWPPALTAEPPLDERPARDGLVAEGEGGDSDH
jgi:hypothetical protein